jgi:phage-related protein/predicted  nucleic acid-binding Zn-ribbon protein
MAGFGGAVKLTGESEYRQALTRISQNLREVGSEMKVVSSQYAKSDNSQAALTARTEVLNHKMAVQKEQLSTLNAQYRAMSAQYTANNDKHKALVASYEAEKQKLSQIEATLGKTSPEYQAQAKVVANLAHDVDKSSAALNYNETQMSKLRTQMNNAQAAINKTDSEIKSLSPDMDKAGKSANELGNEAQESGKKAADAGGGYTVFKNVLANLATSAVQAAVSGLQRLGSAFVDLTKQSVEAYSTYEQAVGGVQTLFGTGGDSLEEYAARVGKSVDAARGEFDKLTSTQNQVVAYANEAWKTAGMSANDYMNTVTSFSASLISSLGGDTAEAAKVANRAVIDMSDNANKMGTDIESIVQTYQSLARGNYAMLDNLKLGFGGTKEEAKRLVEESSKLTDVQKELGVTVKANDLSFGNLVNAISVMQKKMNIAGTTFKEGATTIEGSMNMVKASWQNVLTAIGSGDGMGDAINNLVSSVGFAAKNLLPVVGNSITGIANLVSNLVQSVLPEILAKLPDKVSELLPTLSTAITSLVQSLVTAMPQLMDAFNQILATIGNLIIANLPQIVQAGMQILISLVQGITEALPQLIDMLPTIIQQTVQTLLTNLPELIQAGVQLLLALTNGLMEALPQLIQMLPGIVMQITNVLLDNLPLIIEAGIQILIALIEGLTEAIPQLIAMLPGIIVKIVNTFSAHLPEILSTGHKMMIKLADGILNGVGNVINGAKKIVSEIIKALKEAPGRVLDIGKNIVKGLWQGLKDSVGWLRDKLSGWVSGIMKDIKGFFGIHSPSRVMRDEVGKFLAEGIGVGFEDEMGAVSKQMQDAMPSPDAFAQSYNLGTVSAAQQSSNGYGYGSQSNIVDAIVDALQNVRVVLDDEVAGRFVKKTVTAAIYG